jgi:hypothetical protein
MPITPSMSEDPDLGVHQQLVHTHPMVPRDPLEHTAHVDCLGRMMKRNNFVVSAPKLDGRTTER